uniref:Ribosomal protein S18 n=1 Tax=Knipowitschia caucasica TaxID=637954 RepID=A0AAV2IQE0_KNICA
MKLSLTPKRRKKKPLLSCSVLCRIFDAGRADISKRCGQNSATTAAIVPRPIVPFVSEKNVHDPDAAERKYRRPKLQQQQILGKTNGSELQREKSLFTAIHPLFCEL